jgi:OOP family OmpA-OmpF porin
MNTTPPRPSFRLSIALLAGVALLAALLVASVLIDAVDGSGSSASGCPQALGRHPADATTLVVEGDLWSGYAPFRDPHLLDGTGYTLQYEEQLCQDMRAADVSAGKADFEVTTLDQVVLNHPDGVVVGLIDQSRGADALALNTVKHPYLHSVDDLPQLVEESKGGTKPVLAYTGNSPSEMLLNELANTTEGLRLNDFDLVSVDQSSSALAMLDSGQADLAVIWAPDTVTARAAGYTITLSSKDVPDAIIDVLVASSSTIEKHPAAVQAMVDSYYGYMGARLSDSERLLRLVADDGQLETADAQAVLDGMKLYSAAEADTFVNANVFPVDQPQLAQSAKSIGAVLALNHPGIDVDRVHIDGRYISAAHHP